MPPQPSTAQGGLPAQFGVHVGVTHVPPWQTCPVGHVPHPPPQLLRQISPPVPHCVGLCWVGCRHLPYLPVQQPAAHFFAHFFFFFLAWAGAPAVHAPVAASAEASRERRELANARRRSSNWEPSVRRIPGAMRTAKRFDLSSSYATRRTKGSPCTPVLCHSIPGMCRR